MDTGCIGLALVCIQFREIVLPGIQVIGSARVHRWTLTHHTDPTDFSYEARKRPYCHFELQRGPAPNIAHSFFASPEKPFGSGRDVGDIQRLGRAANGRAVAAEFLLFRISHSLIGRVQRFLQLYKLGCRSALTN
jgi:hypothetical protein